MGLEWIDTWAGLAGFVAVLAWIGNQNVQTRKFLEHRFQAIEQRLHAIDRRIDKTDADLKAEIAQGRQDLRESEGRVLAFMNKRLDDLNKRLDDFKDFVLTRINGSPRRRAMATADAPAGRGANQASALAVAIRPGLAVRLRGWRLRGDLVPSFILRIRSFERFGKLGQLGR